MQVTVEEILKERASYRVTAERDINAFVDDMKARVVTIEGTIVDLKIEKDGKEAKFAKLIDALSERTGTGVAGSHSGLVDTQTGPKGKKSLLLPKNLLPAPPFVFLAQFIWQEILGQKQ